MEPTQFFQWLIEQPVYKGITSMITGAAVLAAITPNKTDNLILSWVRWLVDVVALNVGNAKNAVKK